MKHNILCNICTRSYSNISVKLQPNPRSRAKPLRNFERGSHREHFSECFQNLFSSKSKVVKNFVFFLLFWPYFAAGRNHFSNFCRRLYKKNFCETKFKSMQWLMKKSRLKVFFYCELWRPFCAAERNCSSNFGRGSSKKNVCEILSKPMQGLFYRRTFV